MRESVIYDKTYQFAIRIVNAYRYLIETKKEFVLSKQLLRSGTSIGANVAEAKGAISVIRFLCQNIYSLQRNLRNQILAFSAKGYEIHRRKIIQ